MALATVREKYDNHCGYINCWVDGRSPNCETACVWRMYKFCRIVAGMARNLWSFEHELSIQHRGRRILFDLRIGNTTIGKDLNEDSEDEVVCVGGNSGHICFQFCGDLGHSFDGCTWMPTCCFANELHTALKSHTIASGGTRCTLEWVFSARIDALGIDVLRNEIEFSLNPSPEGILIAWKLMVVTG